MNFHLATKLSALIMLAGAVFAIHPVFAQQIQIPSLQVCNATKLSANAYVIIDTRKDLLHTGLFVLKGSLACDPAGGTVNPIGALGLYSISMSDSTIQGDIVFTTFDQLTSGGKHTPTLWVSGQCKAANVRGCHYWLMVVDNVRGQPVGKTFDVVSFLVFDEKGKRVAYGTGNVVDGDVTVSAAN
ncbi:MAG: hypothetical protein ABIP64_02835 [Burkholderiales bacterium]